MRFDIVTLFPELFDAHLKHGITRRAFDSGAVQVQLWPLRDFADDAHRRVDDRPYGGGPGMVMLAEPLQRALSAVRAQRADAQRLPVLHFTPAGRRLDQAQVQEFAAGPGAVLLCGRYEGVDDRVRSALATEELSVGDYVLSGGELPALVIVDAVVRLLPGAVGDEASVDVDSFSHGLLDYPHFTRPAEFRGLRVPDVLLSGNHADIRRWRRRESLARTLALRPDLLPSAELDEEAREILRALMDERGAEDERD
jgi:tRNA (guanine37-N1)-methyltransferase